MALFEEKAPGIMRLLMADFDIDKTDAGAVLGNLGHESGGFKHFQELEPLAGRGGWGWAQWTGGRRKQFEAYCKRNGLDPKSDKANYGFLFMELKGIVPGGGDVKAKKAIDAVKKAKTLDEKVEAFELAFERAHKDHKHYAERVAYAKRAIAAFDAAPPVPIPTFTKADLLKALARPEVQLTIADAIYG